MKKTKTFQDTKLPWRTVADIIKICPMKQFAVDVFGESPTIAQSLAVSRLYELGACQVHQANLEHKLTNLSIKEGEISPQLYCFLPLNVPFNRFLSVDTTSGNAMKMMWQELATISPQPIPAPSDNKASEAPQLVSSDVSRDGDLTFESNDNLASEVEEQSGFYLKLSSSEFVIGINKSFNTTLFVRPCYEQLWQRIQQEIKADDQDRASKRRFLVTGTPGLGKSYFLFYVLWQLRQMENRLGTFPVYIDSHFSSQGQQMWRFCGDSVALVDRVDIDDKKAYYLVDPGHSKTSPLFCSGITIIAASPKHVETSLHEWIKETPSQYYMPIWTTTEIMACRSICFPDTPTKTVMELIDICGPVPRWVLQNANDDPKAIIDKALGSAGITSPQELFKSLAAGDKFAEISNKLLHYTVDENFKQVGVCFASAYIQNYLTAAYVDSQTQALVNFLRVSAGMGDLAALRGPLFESFAHPVLVKGGKFKQRKLSLTRSEGGDQGELKDEPEEQDNSQDDEEESEEELEDSHTSDGAETKQPLELKPRSCELVGDLLSFLPRSKKYLRPRSPNNPAVDAIIPYEKMAFQMAVRLEHPVKSKPLMSLVEAMLGKTPAATDRVKLYFVVPPDMFPHFKWQPYLGTKKQVLKRIPAVLERVDQYVLEIPFSFQV
jgi:hypothetical protein